MKLPKSKGLSVLPSANFVALLFGVLGAVFGVGAVIALYISAIDADQRIAEEHSRAAKANERAEEARAENVALARAAVSRHVVFPGPGNIVGFSGYLTDLARYRGTKVSIEPADDPDAINFATELSTALKALGWKPELIDEKHSGVSPRAIMEGVTVLVPIRLKQVAQL